MKVYDRALVALQVLLIAMLFAGCIAKHQFESAGVMPSSLHKFLPAGPGTTPIEFKGVSDWLQAFVILGVLVLVGAVTVYFCVPEAHKLSFAVAAGAASLVGTSLMLRESLWAIPWFSRGVIGLFLLAVGFFIYEVYARVRAKKPATLADALGDIPAAVRESAETFETASPTK